MFKKDTLRLIKKTFNRFSSLLIIVLIGVAFMMGLLASPVIMRTSVSDFAKRMNLQDVQIYSLYGFDDNDIKALSKSSVVKEIEASKQIDVYCDTKNSTNIVARVLEDNPTINKFEIKSGNMPENENECLVLFVSLNKNAYQVGDKLSFHLDEGDDLTESLSVTEYTVSGICESPAYCSNMLGPSNLNNLDLGIIVYVPSENFKSEYYTTVLITLKGSEDYLAYTNEYEEFASTQIKRLNTVISSQQDKRKDEILAEYTKEIEDGKIKLATEKASGQAKLDSAKAQLDDAKKQIEEGEAQLSKYTSIIEYAYDGYKEQRAALDLRQATNKAKIAEIERQSSLPFDDARAAVAADLAEYNSNKTIISTTKETISDLYIRQVALEESLDSTAESDTLARTAIRLAIETVKAEITASTAYYNSEGVRLEKRNEEINNKYKALGYSGVEDASSKVTEIYTEIQAIDSAMQLIGSVDTTVDKAKADYDAQLKKLEDGKKQYQQGLKEYNEGVKKFNKAIEEAEAELRKAEQSLEELPDSSWIVLDRESHYSSYMYRQTCKQMEAICIAMPVLFYLVAALVCLTTMTRLIDEQRGQIGIYVALGYSKLQINGKYISYAIAASLAGSLLGVVVGIFIFPTVIYNAWRLMYNLPDMEILFPIQYIILCVLAFVLLVVLVSINVVRKTLNESAASIMRPKPPKSSKPIFLEKIPALWERFSFTSKVTARNILRYKARFFMTVLGVAGCAALLVVGWGIKDSIRNVVSIQYDEIYRYDFTITAEDDEAAGNIADLLNEDDEIGPAVRYMTYTTKAYFVDDDATITVEVIDANECDDIYNLRGLDHKTGVHLSNSGVIISEKFAKTHKLSAGDIIIIESANGIKKEVLIEAVCEMYVMHYLYISDVYYQELFDESIHKDKIAVVADSSEKIDQALDGVEGVVDVYNLLNAADNFNKMIKALDYIILVIIITAGSLALVVLFNLTQVNISERMREIATLKVLGFNDREVNAYIFKEILLLSFIGGLIGMPLGVVEHHFIMTIIDMDMLMFAMNISLLSFASAFLITMIFTAVVLFFTRKPLRNVNMIESLKSVE